MGPVLKIFVLSTLFTVLLNTTAAWSVETSSLPISDAIQLLDEMKRYQQMQLMGMDSEELRYALTVHSESVNELVARDSSIYYNDLFYRSWLRLPQAYSAESRQTLQEQLGTLHLSSRSLPLFIAKLNQLNVYQFMARSLGLEAGEELDSWLKEQVNSWKEEQTRNLKSDLPHVRLSGLRFIIEYNNPNVGYFQVFASALFKDLNNFEKIRIAADIHKHAPHLFTFIGPQFFKIPLEDWLKYNSDLLREIIVSGSSSRTRANHFFHSLFYENKNLLLSNFDLNPMDGRQIFANNNGFTVVEQLFLMDENYRSQILRSNFILSDNWGLRLVDLYFSEDLRDSIDIGNLLLDRASINNEKWAKWVSQYSQESVGFSNILSRLLLTPDLFMLRGEDAKELRQNVFEAVLAEAKENNLKNLTTFLDRSSYFMPHTVKQYAESWGHELLSLPNGRIHQMFAHFIFSKPNFDKKTRVAWLKEILKHPHPQAGLLSELAKTMGLQDNHLKELHMRGGVSNSGDILVDSLVDHILQLETPDSKVKSCRQIFFSI